MKTIVITLALVLSGFITSLAQTTNEISSLSLSPLSYITPENKTTVGSVLGTIAEAAAGQTSNNRHPEVVSYIEAVVRTAFTDVRRLAPVDGEATFKLSGEVDNVSTWTKCNRAGGSYT